MNQKCTKCNIFQLDTHFFKREFKNEDRVVYDFDVKDINGETYSMEKYKGKVLLIVNTARRDMEAEKKLGELDDLYLKHKHKGFELLAFPCN